MFSNLDSGSEYYWEIKSTASYSIKKLKLFLLFGYGQYFVSKNGLIEYGGGVAYPIKNFDIGMQMSSFDGVAYVSPSITYNIQFKQKKRDDNSGTSRSPDPTCSNPSWFFSGHDIQKDIRICTGRIFSVRR